MRGRGRTLSAALRALVVGALAASAVAIGQVADVPQAQAASTVGGPITRSHDLYLYQGNGTGGFLSGGTFLNNNWSAYDTIF